MSRNYYLQKSPFIVPTDDDKYIAEHVGKATDGNDKLSIAHMVAPPGWSEPAQTPEFDEYTLVVKGRKKVVVDGDTIILNAGESIKICRSTTVHYSNPFGEPCEYVSVCTPAFSLEKAHREV
ncbi:cupin domain-containing protein [Maribacter chungangensis]|uniref:Cupin domain-containing protein n=1 Tax=Maribacter chungangensis TaxID=1069117 RepID=A0ABW3B0T0_9FLAO